MIGAMIDAILMELPVVIWEGGEAPHLIVDESIRFVGGIGEDFV
jgi:hypothetical protein